MGIPRILEWGSCLAFYNYSRFLVFFLYIYLYVIIKSTSQWNNLLHCNKTALLVYNLTLYGVQKHIIHVTYFQSYFTAAHTWTCASPYIDLLKVLACPLSFADSWGATGGRPSALFLTITTVHNQLLTVWWHCTDWILFAVKLTCFWNKQSYWILKRREVQVEA